MKNFFYAFSFLIYAAQADTERLQLSGRVFSHSSTTITESKSSLGFSQWKIIHLNNSVNTEAEKIEIEGQEQLGLTKKVDLAAYKGKFIQRKILLDLVSYNQIENKPIILKISAN